jgi:site-specific DNA recombinase
VGTSPASIDIYARVSRAGDNQQRSIKGQIADCQVSLKDRGLPAGEVFIDSGKSAWNPRVKRPGWEALMRRMETGESAGVIVFDLERFARNFLDGERLVAAAEHGATIMEINQAYDLTTASGEKSFRDAMSAAAFYSRKLSERVRRGKRIKARAGELNVSSRPFGFRLLAGGRIEPHSEEAPILAELTARFLAGDTQQAIIIDLARRGILTSYGKPWTRAGLRQVLTRPLNCGQVIHTDPKTKTTAVVARLVGDPVISEEDFAKVLAVYGSRRPGRPPSPAYLCSGIALCGLCQKRLGGRPRINMRRYSDGEVRRQYWCVNSNGGCGKIAIDQRALDEAAGTLSVAILSDPQNATAVAQAQAEQSELAAELDEAIARDEGLALALSARLGRGELSLDRYDATVKPLDERLTELRAQRAALADSGSEPPPDAGEQWQARWDAADLAGKRTLLRMALRGRPILVGPADRAAPRVADAVGRIRLGETRGPDQRGRIQLISGIADTRI